MHRPAPHRPLDLTRQLIVRVVLFALVVLLVGTVVALVETRYRVRADIERTGQTIRQLITDEVQRSAGPFHRTLDEFDINLESLQPIGNLIPFCIRLTNIYAQAIGERCFDRPIDLPAPLAGLMRQVIGEDAAVHGIIGHYPGITVGQVTITPNHGRELLALGHHLVNLLAVSLTIMLMSFLIYRPVRAALAPSEVMLATLRRMEEGDLGARMPALPLIELERIGQGFNHLAGQLQETIARQQQLARRLLTAREEERLHLSRELHDEFGQYLASLNAEAGYIRELADERLPELRPSADAVGRTVQHMMEVLQQILHRLRPIGLDQFGLQASLEQLVRGWNERQHGLDIQLHLAAGLDALSDDHAVTLYRITQEAITNARRHGHARHLEIDIQLTETDVLLTIVDDGSGPPDQRAGRPPQGSYGLLGMEERILALGGQLHIGASPAGGTCLQASLPRGEQSQRLTGNLS